MSQPSEGKSASESTKAAAKKPKKAVHDKREHLNIVFIGHVDAGKSTISGQLLYQIGQVDERTMAKYQKEAKDKGRDSWSYAYIMDTNEAERAKGKTVEVGRAQFATQKKRYTLLDAPGHKNYVPNMIEGTAQADVGVLVISARKDEFETGFDRGGQTREHAMLAKTLGIQRLIVLVNKMDERTVRWSEERFNAIEKKMLPFLKKWGYNTKKDVVFCPCSGLSGQNLAHRIESKIAPWYKGISFLETLDGLKPLKRNAKAPVRVPIVTRFKTMGNLWVLGKLETGTLTPGPLLMMPIEKKVDCTGITIDNEDVAVAKPGENIQLKAKGVEESEIQGGYVLCSLDKPCQRSRAFEAQIAVLDLLPHKPLVTAGYQAVLHIHSLEVECEITRLLTQVNRKKAAAGKRRPRFLKPGDMATVRIETEHTIALELFKETPQLGRLSLRDEGKTIAIGKVVNVINAEEEAKQ